MLVNAVLPAWFLRPQRLQELQEIDLALSKEESYGWLGPFGYHEPWNVKGSVIKKMLNFCMPHMKEANTQEARAKRERLERAEELRWQQNH